ncbi:hypothetical protein RYX36_014228 [Vicia faba]
MISSRKPEGRFQDDDMAAVGIQALHIDELLAVCDDIQYVQVLTASVLMVMVFMSLRFQIWLILMRMVVLGVMHLVCDCF